MKNNINLYISTSFAMMLTYSLAGIVLSVIGSKQIYIQAASVLIIVFFVMFLGSLGWKIKNKE